MQFLCFLLSQPMRSEMGNDLTMKFIRIMWFKVEDITPPHVRKEMLERYLDWGFES